MIECECVCACPRCRAPINLESLSLRYGMGSPWRVGAKTIELSQGRGTLHCAYVAPGGDYGLRILESQWHATEEGARAQLRRRLEKLRDV